jgi:hypothetical protein
LSQYHLGFLAHHFDLNLEIYQMEKVNMKRSGDLIFLSRLKVEPRVFDFKLDRGLDAVVVADDEVALGELVKNDKYFYASYSPKAKKRLCRHMGEPDCAQWDEDTLAQKVGEMWGTAK